MERGGASVRETKFIFWVFFCLFAVAEAKVETSHPNTQLAVSAAHLYYYCPQGVDAKLECNQKNANSFPKDHVRQNWLYTPHSHQRCQSRVGPRNFTHKDHALPRGVEMDHTDEKMWVILRNVTFADQGRYCCMDLVLNNDHKKPAVVQNSHSHIILHITPMTPGATSCTFMDLTPPPASVPVALALAACILALLSLPLILVLVYKQRQNSQSNRRGQELVRMDSEAPGHDNPVFMGGSPQTKTRTLSQILTRQPSESGRHLLSDPGTPLSPPAHGDVFFPSEDIIPESPDLVQI